MIKPPVVYVAGMLRQTGTYITTRRLGLDARPDGPAPVLPAERERLGAERGLALDELAAHALPGRGVAPARCDRGRRDPGAADARGGARALARLRRASRGRARRRPRRSRPTAGAASPAGTRSGRSSTTGPSASACCARSCSPAPTRRSADAARLQRLARHPCRAAQRRRPARADPGAGARRPARSSSAGRALAPQPAGRRRRAAARRQRRPRPLDARRARGGRGPGRRCARMRRSSSRSTSTAATTASTRSCRSATRATRELRSRIGVDPATALPLGDTPSFGWHPSLAGLRELYDAGKVAVLPAVDYAHPDQSHFNSGGYWRSGIVGPAPDRTGWLGRTLDAIGTRDNPLQGIHVGWGQDPSLNGHRAPVATRVLALATSASTSRTSGTRRPSCRPTAGSRAHAPSTRPWPPCARCTATRSRRTTASRRWPRRTSRRRRRVAYPDSDLGKALGNLGRLLGAGFGTRVATVSSGGFDTHDAQADGARRAAAGPRRLAARLAGRPRRARALASAC